MINLIFGNKTKKVPKKWNEITVEQYQQITKLDLDNTKESMMEIVSVFTELSIETLEAMAYKEYAKLADICTTTLIDLQNRKKVIAKSFKFKGKKYKLIKDIYKVSTNDFFAIESYIKKDLLGNVHKIIPLLYRNKKVMIYDECCKHLSCDIALSVLDFIAAHVQK